MPNLRFNPTGDVIVTEVKLTASLATTARMVFDTGATFVMLPWKIATGIGLEIDPKRIIQTTTASTVESAPLVVIPKVSVLGEEIENVEALVKDLPPKAGVDGLLGMSFIKYFNVEINFEKGKLIFDRLRKK